MSKPVSLFMSYSIDGACTFHRSLYPARYCSQHVKDKYGLDVVIGDGGLPAGHDAYWLHGLPTPAAVIELAKRKREGAIVIWGMDDDFQTIPDWNPAKPGEDGMACWECMRSLADQIVVSTHQLAATFGHTRNPVLVAPNMLDVMTFPSLQYAENADGVREYQRDVQLPVRVVYSGGPTHKMDVAECEEGVMELLETVPPSEVAVIFNGAMPPSGVLKKYLHRGVIHQPPVPFAQYHGVLQSIRPDVYLAPLAPVEFNRSKSNLRIIESWALNACPIASAWGEYNCVQDGENGVLVYDNDMWGPLLIDLVRDHTKRNRMALAGRRCVEEAYDWNRDKCREEWYAVFRSIFQL